MLLEKGKEITVGGPERDYPGFTSRIVQLAVDEAARQGGGIVRLDKGTFAITGPIRLSDGVSLIGAGPETVLRKVAGVKSRFIVDADYGELRVEVEDGSGFQVGMGIQVFDESQKWGWAESTAVITAIEGNVLRFDRYLARDYRSDDGGMVTNACSVIEGVEVEQARISDLRIDGNKAVNEPIGGCRAGDLFAQGEQLPHRSSYGRAFSRGRHQLANFRKHIRAKLRDSRLFGVGLASRGGCSLFEGEGQPMQR